MIWIFRCKVSSPWSKPMLVILKQRPPRILCKPPEYCVKIYGHIHMRWLAHEILVPNQKWTQTLIQTRTRTHTCVKHSWSDHHPWPCLSTQRFQEVLLWPRSFEAGFPWFSYEDQPPKLEAVTIVAAIRRLDDKVIPWKKLQWIMGLKGTNSGTWRAAKRHGFVPACRTPFEAQ